MQRRGSVNGNSSSGSRVRVAVRVRPPDYKLPRDESLPPCVETTPTTVTYHHEPQTKNYTYDHVFDPTASQEDVYMSSLQPLLAPFLDGFNVTVMAYGQTGTGKTHTMGGKATVFNTTPTTSPIRNRSTSIPMPSAAVGFEARNYRGAPEDGLVPRFLNDLFSSLKREPATRTVRVTFVEIYCDTIRDLLDDRANKSIVIREDAHNVVLENVRVTEVESLHKALELWNQGRSRQATGSNAMNDESSRSHAVYTMEVSRKFRSEIKKSKLTFVDLAGSERLKKTQVEGVRKKESIQINVGLSALGNVINALADSKTGQRRSSVNSPTSRSSSSAQEAYVPYRASKLTRLLQDALGGNSRTLFVACVSSLDSNADETLCTLQYANRARNIQNKAEKNAIDHHEPLILAAIHPSPPELVELARLQNEVAKLRQQVAEMEAVARVQGEEAVQAERLRAEKKEKKRNDRRDVEVTTEINILPCADAQTQVEGEHTGEQHQQHIVVEAETLSTAENGTETEPASAIEQADAAVQFGVAFSATASVETATDVEAPLMTAEASTECTVVLVECAVQSTMSCFNYQDAEVETDVYPLIETTDSWTDCADQELKAATADIGAQSVASSQDAAMNTDIMVAETQTMDACTEWDATQVSGFSMDAEVQFDAPIPQLRHIDVATDPEVPLATVDAGTECSPEQSIPVTTADMSSQTHAVEVVVEPVDPIVPVLAARQETCRLETASVSGNDDVDSSDDALVALAKVDMIGQDLACCGADLPLCPSPQAPLSFSGSERSSDGDQPSAPIDNVDLAMACVNNVSVGDEKEEEPYTSKTSEDLNPAIAEFSDDVSTNHATAEKFESSLPALAAYSLQHKAWVDESCQDNFTPVAEKTGSKLLAPEFQEDDFALVSCALSENQLEVVTSSEPACPCEFVCGADPVDAIEMDSVMRDTANLPNFESMWSDFEDDCEFSFPEDLDADLQAIHSPVVQSLAPTPLLITVRPSWELPSERPTPTSMNNGENPPAQNQSTLPVADFVVARSPRRPPRSQLACNSRSSRQSKSASTIRPLRMFAFDDEIATAPSEKTTAQAKALYAGIRELVHDEFGEDNQTTDDEPISADILPSPPSATAITQLLSETQTLITRRRQQQQRIAHLRRRVQALEELLQVANRAPIAETDLQAYSKRVQQEFLTKLVRQLTALAAQRLHSRLRARLEAEQVMPLSVLDGDDCARSPFLSVAQCQACADWFFHKPEDVELFEKQLLPLISSGWISLTTRELDAEQSWFQL